MSTKQTKHTFAAVRGMTENVVKRYRTPPEVQCGRGDRTKNAEGSFIIN